LKGNRVQVILECTEHKESGVPGTSRYITTKNRKNTPDRVELKKYNPELLDKQRIIAVSKSDLIDEKTKLKIQKDISKKIKDIPFEFISSVSNVGLVEIKDLLWKVLNE